MADLCGRGGCGWGIEIVEEKGEEGGEGLMIPCGRGGGPLYGWQKCGVSVSDGRERVLGAAFCRYSHCIYLTKYVLRN